MANKERKTEKGQKGLDVRHNRPELSRSGFPGGENHSSSGLIPGGARRTRREGLDVSRSSSYTPSASHHDSWQDQIVHAAIDKNLHNDLSEYFVRNRLHQRMPHLSPGDVISEVATRFLARTPPEGIRNFDAFFRKSLFNYIRSQLREAGVREAHAQKAGGSREAHATEPPTEETALRNITSERVRERWRGLPSSQRNIIALRFFEERSTRETAEILGTSVMNVRLQTHRAKNRLRAELKDKEDI